MRKVKNLNKTLSVALALNVLLLGFIYFNNTREVGGISISTVSVQGVATSSSVDIGTTNLEPQNPNPTITNRVIATTTNDRYYTIICNVGVQPAYLSMASDSPAVALAGIPLNPMASSSPSCFEITQDRNLYTGSIRAVTQTASTTLSVTDIWLK